MANLLKISLVSMHRPVASLAGGMAILVGALVLLGWIMDITAFKSVIPGYATMKTNTALCFTLSGAALYLLAGDRVTGPVLLTARLCALLVAGIAALTLAQDVSGMSVGIDQLLVLQHSQAGDAEAPGRMALAIAFNFILVGIALLLNTDVKNRYQVPAQAAMLIVIFTGILALSGHAYGVEKIYFFEPMSSMALHTAATFILLATGVLALQPHEGLIAVLTAKHSGAMMARVLLPFALILPLAGGWLGIKGEDAGLYSDRLEMALFAILIITFFVILIWLSAWRLNLKDITIRQRETLFQRLDEASLDAHIFVNPRGRIVSCNSQAGKMFGHTRQELYGLPLEVLIPARFRARHAQHLAAYFANPYIRPMGIGMELFARRRDGGEFPVEISLSPVQTQDELQVYTVIHDITDHKQAETALRTSEALLSNALKMARAGHWEYDVGNDLFTFNDNFYAIFRTTAAQMGGYTMSSTDYAWRFVHPDEVGLVAEEIRKAIETADPEYNRELEHRFLYADGEVGHIAVRFFLVKDEQGRTVKIYGVNQNITGRRRAEEALRESEQRLKQVLSNLPVAAYTCDETGLINFYNQKAEEIWGRAPKLNDPADRYCGAYRMFKPDGELIPHDRCGMAVLLKEKKPAIGTEAVIEKPDGKRLSVLTHASPIKDISGRMVSAVNVLVDITERKRTETVLQNYARQQEVIARLGREALDCKDPVVLMNSMTRLVAETLDVEYCNVLELLPGRHALLLRSGMGWKEGAVGRVSIGININSPEGYTLRSREPVVVEDMHNDTRFTGSPLLLKHGVVSSINITIGQMEKPCGILGVHTRTVRKFTRDDVNFLQVAADLLAEVIERRQAEEATREAERRLTVLVGNLPGAVYRCKNDRDWTMEFMSAGIKPLTGYAPDSFMCGDINYNAVIVPEDRERVWDEVQKGLAMKKHFQLEYRICTATGEVKWIYEQGCGVYDDNGRLQALEGFMADDTARKQAGQKLAAAKEHYHHLLNSTPGVIYATTYTMPHRCIFVSDTLEQITGFAPHEMLDDPGFWLRHVHPQDREQALATMELDLAAGGSTKEYRFRHKNNRYLWIRDIYRVIHDNEGHPLEIVGAWTDITESRNTEEQLAHARKMEAVGQLTGGVAHDFNNRLMVIMGNLEILMQKLADNPDTMDLLESTLTATAGAAELTSQLLTFSRKQVLELSLINLNELITGMYDMLKRTLGETIKVVVVPAADLWPVRTDRHLLINALLNIAVNARDAMPRGGRLILETQNVILDDDYITTHSFSTPGKYMRLSVTDTGSGMSEETRRHIFEPFFTTKEEGRGTGLGLAMVYGFVKQSRGEIEVYSEPGHGTSFKIYLPKDESIAQAKEPVLEQGSGKSMAAQGKTVLLVEDEDAVRNVVVILLAEMGCKVLAASSGPAALEIFNGEPGIDLLFTDMIMPGGMTGLELAAKMRETRPMLRVLYTSGYAPQAAADSQTIEHPFDFWLAKPYRAQALRDTVMRALGDS